MSEVPLTAVPQPTAAAVTYEIVPFDHATSTPADQRRIGEIYTQFLSLLGLVFDPSLDPDFQNPCKYYGPESGGAYFVALQKTAPQPVVTTGATAAGPVAPAPTRDEDTAPATSAIAATVGVRPIDVVSNSALCEDFLAGITDVAVRERVRGAIFDNTSKSTATARVCEIKRMASLPSCRGHGVGKALLNAALTWARTEGGYAVAVLDTKRFLEAANHIYERYGGFVDCGNYNASPRADRFMVVVL